MQRSAEAPQRVEGVLIMADESKLTTAAELHERDLADPAYRAEHERTRFANEVAIQVIRYRAEHGLTQTSFGRLVGMRQPHVARLEAGEHEPSVSTLAKLSAALGVDFTVAITPEGVRLRQTA
jgi:DNA-binding XRE family transcriptional regulator